jgi:tetratricopeptide (TPR) repeat protein
VEPRKRTRALARCFALLAAAASAPAAARDTRHEAELSAWQDIESRIQYGYFTEDARALDSLRQQLPAEDAADKLKSYYTGLLAYRLIQLTVRSDETGKPVAEATKARTRELLDRCIESLDGALKIEKDFAEALALQSACRGMAADLESWRVPFAATRSGTEIKRALELEPANPRVLLLQAMVEYERSRVAGEKTQDKALQELKKAVAGFEAERQDVDRVPGWGAADAYFLLARIYYERGDAVTARDALERALLLAPEFAQARRLLLRITS